MPDEYVDPSGNTEQFRAFVQSADPPPAKAGVSRALVIGIVAAVVVVAAVFVILAM